MTIARQRFSKNVPAATNRRSNTRTVRGGGLCSVRLEVIKEEFSSVACDSSFVFGHSGREDTRSPVRNGAGLRQSLIVSCYNLF
jgi:hypothetical protein